MDRQRCHLQPRTRLSSCMFEQVDLNLSSGISPCDIHRVKRNCGTFPAVTPQRRLSSSFHSNPAPPQPRHQRPSPERRASSTGRRQVGLRMLSSFCNSQPSTRPLPNLLELIETSPLLFSLLLPSSFSSLFIVRIRNVIPFLPSSETPEYSRLRVPFPFWLSHLLRSWQLLLSLTVTPSLKAIYRNPPVCVHHVCTLLSGALIPRRLGRCALPLLDAIKQPLQPQSTLQSGKCLRDPRWIATLPIPPVSLVLCRLHASCATLGLICLKLLFQALRKPYTRRRICCSSFRSWSHLQTPTRLCASHFSYILSLSVTVPPRGQRL